METPEKEMLDAVRNTHTMLWWTHAVVPWQ